MSGVAAIAFLAVVTSCSKSTDLYDQDAQNLQKELVVNKNYAAAFEKAFGTVGSNVDWGFSSKIAKVRGITRSVGTYADYKGNLKPVNLTFPEDCDINEFTPDLTNVPSYDDYCKTLGNANWTPDEFAYGEVYIDKVQKIHIWGEYGKRAKLYIKAGEYDFTNETFDLCADADLYLLSGAIVTLNNTAANTAKFDVYIAPNAKLIANGENGFRADVDAHVYNHGIIECSKFVVDGTSFLYNVGTLNVPNGQVYIENSTARIVNDGVITSESVFVKGSGALQNNAEWTVTGNTIVNCDNGGWVNNGHWTTLNYQYSAGSENVINNCFLEVQEDFNINMSSASSDDGFKIDTGGGVLTKNFNGGGFDKRMSEDPNAEDAVSGPYKVIMGHKSLFKVTGTATLEGGNKGWGFFGPADGEYAVFQAKNVVRAAGLENTQGAVTYGGNLYVSAETHFAQGHDGMDADGHYFISEVGGFSVNTNIYAAGFKAGKPNINIPKTPCNPGFNGDEPTPLYRVIAEDLSAEEASDFDFNDVVFDVVKAEGGKTTLKLICAGGVLPLKVMGIEVHGLFGETAPNANGEYKMYNTGAGPTVPAKEFEVNGTYTTPAEIKNIKIEVLKSGVWMELKANTGEAACKILVDDTFVPVEESKNIANEYGLFTDYVQGNFVDDFWWK